MKEILNVIHNTIYKFFDVCNDNEEVPMSDKDKLLLEVNKAICNNLKALKQQPCEDCISRQRVLDIINFEYKWLLDAKVYDICTSIAFSAIMSKISEMPSVTPQQKLGRWIDDKCSVCGKGIEDLISSSEWYRNEEPNFCPFCGARMEV